MFGGYKMRKKVLQICAVATSVDKQLKPLIEASISQGFEVHIACSKDNNFNQLVAQGYEMFEVNISRKVDFKKNLLSIWHLYKLMKKNKYDIVHVHTPVAAILGRIAAKLAGVKNIVYTAHGYFFHEEMSKLKYCFYYFLEKFFARFFTDYLLLQSKEDYELSIKKHFKQKEKTIHLGNGVDIKQKFNLKVINQEPLKNLRDEFNILSDDLIISFVGRLVREKGVIELVESFQELNKEKKNMKLLLIGEVLESERDQFLKNKLGEWQEDKNIVFTGARNDINLLLALSDFFVLPSYREGLPRSIIEAMAMENPIIATNIRGCREEVQHGENGFLIETKNKIELQFFMKKLLDDRNLRKSMGEVSRQIVEKEYDEKKSLNKQIKLFNTLFTK